MPSRMDVTRKGPARWPWAVGVALMVLVIWGITSLLARPPETEPTLSVPTVEDTHPPTAIPLPPAPGVVHDTTLPVAESYQREGEGTAPASGGEPRDDQDPG